MTARWGEVGFWALILERVGPAAASCLGYTLPSRRSDLTG